MSKRDRRTYRKERQDPPEKNIQQPAKKAAQDSFSNPLARLGIGSPNLLMATEYPITRMTREYNTLNSLYRNSWIAKKIINTIPEDMCKNWFSITAELSPEQTDRFKKLERKTLIKEKILEGLYWGRLYGGAGAIMMIKGHEDRLEEPLNLDEVMPNSFKGLMVVDRWSGIFPGTELVTDIDDPEFGLPAYYEIRNTTDNNVLTKVHHSRVLRFTGRKLPFWEEMAEIGWGASELEHVFDELAKRDNTSWNIAALVFQANLLINTVDGLDQINSMADPQMQSDFYNVKSAQNQMRNNNGMMIIGTKDKVEAIQYTFSGLNDIYESFMLDIAGASEMPVTKLFGRAPAGMNATGESDMQNYHDLIGQQQESHLRPKLEKLLPVMFVSEFGAVPDDLDIKFNPSQTPTEDKMAETVSKKATIIIDAYTAGLINQRMGMQELHELSFTTNMFSSITDEDIEKAEDSFNAGEVPPMTSLEETTQTPEVEQPREELSGDPDGDQ